jgi:hypothetical protein
MTLNADNVRVAVTGAVYFDATSLAAAPTGTGSSVTGMDDLGLIDENGVSLKMPGAGKSTSLKAWQNGATVRTLRTPPEDQPQLHLVLIETKLEVIELAFGVTVTQTATDGAFVINTNVARNHGRLVFDVIDNDELIRLYAPKAVVTELAEIAFTNTDPVGYDLTLDLDFDQTLDGQAKVWMTALKSGA